MRTLRQLAAAINASGVGVARVQPSRSSTDRKIPGTRLIHPGKGRRGSRLTVTKRGRTVFEFDTSETYRTVREAVFEAQRLGLIPAPKENL